MDIKDKVVVITGASSGIGLATAKLFSQKGAKVALVARSKDKLEKLTKELSGSIAIPTDMTKENQIREMIDEVKKHYGRIDVLINNAGRGYDASIDKINLGKYKELFDLNLAGPLVAMQAVIPIMKKQKQGMIVNISSGTSLMYIPSISAYSSLKRALNGISLTAREELKEYGITVSLVYPYITATNFYKNKLNETNGTNEDNRYLREGDSPEHVAEKILEAIKTEKAEIYVHDRMKNL